MDATEKLCLKCQISKSLGEFYKKIGTHDGYDFHCIECRKIQRRDRNAKVSRSKTKNAVAEVVEHFMRGVTRRDY